MAIVKIKDHDAYINSNSVLTAKVRPAVFGLSACLVVTLDCSCEPFDEEYRYDSYREAKEALDVLMYAITASQR